MADEVRTVTIGFDSSIPLEARMTRSEYEKLRKALDDDRAGRWHEVRTQTSEVAVDLAKVVFVRIETEEHRVGF